MMTSNVFASLFLACFTGSLGFSILPTTQRRVAPIVTTGPSSSSALRNPPLHYRVEDTLSEPIVSAPGVVKILEENPQIPQKIYQQPNRLEESFAAAKAKGEAAFVSFVTAGYPTAQDTPSILLAMQEGGASVIELGLPFTDPQADGPTIQRTNAVAIENGTTEIYQVLDMLAKARSMGLTVPVILMGYYNPVYQYGIEDFARDSKRAGADGILLVDLPLEEASTLQEASRAMDLATIPLIAPNCSEERIQEIVETASSFLYCVSIAGVTGARDALPDDLEAFVGRVRSHTDLPLAVGFGISNPDMVHSVANIADGVVVGSAISKAIEEERITDTAYASTTQLAEKVKRVTEHLTSGCPQNIQAVQNQATRLSNKTPKTLQADTSKHYYGDDDDTKFGGQYIPELLTGPFQQLEAGYEALKVDPEFQQEVKALVADLMEQEEGLLTTPLQKAEHLTQMAGGATIWLKREDLATPGVGLSHQKFNSAVGQALMATKFGMTRVIADTVSGQHGIAVAMIAQKLGLSCTVYMCQDDYEREQAINVARMITLGAKVVPIQGRTVKEAVNEASRDMVANIDNTFYVVGSATGPSPLPRVVTDFKSTLGQQIKEQMLQATGGNPDAIVAFVGGSQASAIGAFSPFVQEEDVILHGVEDEHCAPLTKGSPGVLHGALTYLVQDEAGQITSDTPWYYPAAEPEHAHWMHTGRATYRSVPDSQAMEGFRMLSETEGVLPCEESSRAIFDAVALAKQLGPGKDVVVTVTA